LSNKSIFITDDRLLSALSPIPDQVPVQEQPGYMSALHAELEGNVGSPSVTRNTRSASRKSVSHAVPDEAKMQ